MKLRKIFLPIFVIICVFWLFYFVIYPMISSEKKLIIPDLSGMSVEEACEKLEDEKIKYKIVYEENEVDNIVLRTNPTYNTLILESRIIELYISKKPSDVVTDLTGMSYFDALEILKKYEEEYQISINIIYEVNNLCDENTILSQSVTSGNLDEINEITITLSNQKLTVLMPDFVGKYLDEAIYFCNTNGFEISTIYVNSLFNKGMIIYQEIEPNKVLYINSHDNLFFYIAK